MMDWPEVPLIPDDRANDAVSTWSAWSLGPAIKSTIASGTGWTTANLAIFIPFRLPIPRTAYKMVCGIGGAFNNNLDLGLYDHLGNRLVSGGGGPDSGTGAEHIVNITDTLLPPGMYYLAMVCDGTTSNNVVQSALGSNFQKLLGIRAATSAYPLPSTVTFVSTTHSFIPYIAAYFRSE